MVYDMLHITCVCSFTSSRIDTIIVGTAGFIVSDPKLGKTQIKIIISVGNRLGLHSLSSSWS